MEKAIFPRALKVELPEEAVGALKAIKGLMETVQTGAWWAAFEQGFVLGVLVSLVVAVAVIATRRKGP